MDPLASIILHDYPITHNYRKEIPKTLKRAESNRVLYLFLEKLSTQTNDEFTLEKYTELQSKKRDYEAGAQDLLQQLVKANVKFLVIKTARYPHVSFDIDIIFTSPADFEKSTPLLVKSTIRPDPHASSLREYKGATIVLPAEELWTRRKRQRLHNVDVYVPLEEDSAIILLLHMIKHREIFLGDLISLTNLKINERTFHELVTHYKLRVMTHFVTQLLNKLGISDQRYEDNVQLPILDSFINLLAEKKAEEYFPLTLPNPILYLTALKLL